MNKGDCVEITYEGRIQKTGEVFDKSEKPIGIIVGAGYVIEGLDNSFSEHKKGDEYSLKIPAEKGFGKRLGNLLKIVPLSAFKKSKMNPFPGQTVNIDGTLGQVRSVSGGRVIVDFNHPLAGKDLEYDVKIESVVSDDIEKVKNIVTFRTKLSDAHFKVKSEAKKCIVEYKDNEPMFKMAEKILTEDITEYTNFTKVEFVKASAEKKKPKK